MKTLRQLFLDHNAQTTDFPLMLEIEKANGIYLFDPTGKKYIDLISGIGVSNIGHSNPKVVEAIHHQASSFMHLMVYGEYIQTPQVQYAATLASHLPASLQSIYFLNSGSEAIEGAMKLAKRATNRTEIIACHQSYHGSSQGSLSIMGNEEYKMAYRPLLPDISFIKYNELEDLNLITNKTAAVFMETIQGESGVNVPSKDYMLALRKKCTETSTLLIFDEIQCAFGRTGSLFAFNHFNVVPDVLVLAKALGGGMPLGAFCASNVLMSVLKENPILGHISTFGGHPVCCAAGHAAFDFLIENKLIEQVNEKSNLFRDLLIHPLISEFRGKGLMIALQLPDFDTLKKVIDLCIQNGVITDWFLHNNNSMRLAPPLIITEEEIRFCCKVILDSMDQVMESNV